MPSLMLRALDPCPQCGYQTEWFKVGGFRINKHSLRQTSPGLIVHAAPSGGCPECGFHHRSDQTPNRWVIDPKDQPKVDTARAKRGWS